MILTVLAVTAPAAQRPGLPSSDRITLQPGDVVQVTIWREEDLSGEFPVDETGVVTLPLIGEKRVTDIPLGELRDLLIEEYRAELRNPSIQITPLRRVNVLGEVNKPDLYAVDPTITLAGVVALAGGVTGIGDMSRIRIIRGGQVIQERVGAATTLDAVDVQSGDQIVVLQRSWFERNSTFVVSLLLSVSSIAISLLR